MSQAPRSGVAWDQVGPTPVGCLPTVKPRTATPVQQPTPATPVRVVDVISTRILNTFFSTLPPRSIQRLVEVGEARVTAASLASSDGISVVDTAVADKTVWVITNVQFFGLCPSGLLEAPMVAISAEQLTGLIHFELALGDKQPFQVHGSFANPQAAYSTPLLSTGVGWPFTETPLTRNDPLAFYARSNQTIKVTARVEAVPRFWLSTLGARLTGYMLPELTFDAVVSRDGI